MSKKDCQHFGGYKPCARSASCDNSCTSYRKTSQAVLLIHLGALGAVVRSTSLLEAIHRKHPEAYLIWVTDTPAHRLLEGHPLIAKVLTTTETDLRKLRAFQFAAAYVVDKSLEACSIVEGLKIEKQFGFKANPTNGAILPATAAAEELWSLGLSNQKKFFENKKPETQLMIEALELGHYSRDDYNLPLTENEKKVSQNRHETWAWKNDQPVIGLNTGCSNVIQAKRWTVDFHRQVIQKLIHQGYQNIVLLGGPEDTDRNQQIAAGLPVISSPTDQGLRDGLVSVAACDIVITGDSLGMHLAISQKKYVVAWFGPTCAHEIDLYNRGSALLAQVTCSPCWKRSCDKALMCYDQVSMDQIMRAVKEGEYWSQQTRMPVIDL